MTNVVQLMAKYRLFVVAALLFAVIFIIGGLIVKLFEDRRQSDELTSLNTVGSTMAYTVQRQLELSLSSTFALASLVRQSDNHIIENFDLIAADLIDSFGGIDSLQLAPQAVISQIYPLAGNEEAIGHNLLKDPARRTEALAAIESESLTLAGPFELVQGGAAVIGRLPVFIPGPDGEDLFWGFTIALIRMPTLLGATNLDQVVEQGYQYELSRIHPDTGRAHVFASSAQDGLQGAVAVDIEVPNGSWALSLANSGSGGGMWLVVGGMVLVAIISALTAVLLYNHRRRTNDRTEANRALQAEIAERKLAEETLRESDEVARIITSTLDIGEVYEQFASGVKALIDFDGVHINVINPDSSTSQLAYLTSSDPGSFTVGEAFPLESSATGSVFNSRSTLIMDDINEHLEFWNSQLDLNDGFRSVIVVPLISKDRVIGNLAVFSNQNYSFGPWEQAILERLANQIAPAVENARLYTQLRSHAEEMAVVDEVAHIITSTLDIDEVYEQFVAAIKALIDFNGVHINVINPDSNTSQLAYLTRSDPSSFAVGEVFPLESSATGFVFNSRSTLIMHDINEHLEFWNSQLDLDDGFRSEIVVPLISKDRVIGSLVLLSNQNNSFGPWEQAILERLANQIASAVENARLYAQLRSQAEEMVVIDEVARIITSTLDIDEVYEQFTTAIKTLVDADRVEINTIDLDSNTLQLAYLTTVGPRHFAVGEALPLENSASLFVSNSKTTLVMDDVNEHPEFWTSQHILAYGFRSEIVVPLISKDRVIGVLVVLSYQNNNFGPLVLSQPLI